MEVEDPTTGIHETWWWYSYVSGAARKRCRQRGVTLACCQVVLNLTKALADRRGHQVSAVGRGLGVEANSGGCGRRSAVSRADEGSAAAVAAVFFLVLPACRCSRVMALVIGPRLPRFIDWLAQISCSTPPRTWRLTTPPWRGTSSRVECARHNQSSMQSLLPTHNMYLRLFLGLSEISVLVAARLLMPLLSI